MTCEGYEKLCKQQHEKNEEYLNVFERDSIQSGLAQKTDKQFGVKHVATRLARSN
jgi:hypothetical protein